MPPSTELFSRFVEGLRAEAHAGRSVAVHCRASIGRSSLLLAALPTAEGFAPDAFRRLTLARGVQVPDTADQVHWVERFAAARGVLESRVSESSRSRWATGYPSRRIR